MDWMESRRKIWGCGQDEAVLSDDDIYDCIVIHDRDPLVTRTYTYISIDH